MKSPLLFSALLMCAALSAPAQTLTTPAPKPKWQKVYPQTPAGVTQFTEVVASYPEHVVTLTVYVPDAPGSYPAIIDFHGGGWAARQVEADKPMMERLAARGFVTALVSYRVSGEAKYPAALHDCKAGVRCLRANAAKWKIDPSRIGCIGGSAGGHLSGLVGMTSELKEFDGNGPFKDQNSNIQACIVMAATQDLVAAYQTKESASAVAFFGAGYADNPELYKQASPITHVRKGVPPTIFIEGERDSLKIGRAEMMTKLKELGIETAVHTLKDAPHPFWMSQPWCDQTVEIADAFFKKHLATPVLAK